jgi:anti-anti-sigma regulatory factor
MTTTGSAGSSPVAWLVLDADAMTHVDATGLDALIDVTKDLGHDDVTLVMARLRTRLKERFEEAGVLDVIGREGLYPTVRAAVNACARRGGGP